jgi:hypothetical protein
MLKPAILFKEEITRMFQELYYTDEMMYVTGCNENWVPEIADTPDESTIQFAILNSKNECIGYVGFRVDWYSSCAYNFAIISFDKGNINIASALKEVVDKITNEYHLRRMEWRMIGGNPVEKHYDKFCNSYSNSNKYVLHEAMRDRHGKYHDDIIYEILF